MSRVTRTTGYFVRASVSGGGGYLAQRVRRTLDGKYYWAKDKTRACVMSYDAAQKCRSRYGGSLVKRVTTDFSI